MFDNENIMVVKDDDGNDIVIEIPSTPQPQIIMEFSTGNIIEKNNDVKSDDE